jgi:hypothetical protein
MKFAQGTRLTAFDWQYFIVTVPTSALATEIIYSFIILMSS